MVRSDGWGNGLQPSRLCETLGVFEFIVRYGYFDLQCIMGLVILGGRKKEVIGSSYSSEIINDTLRPAQFSWEPCSYKFVK